MMRRKRPHFLVAALLCFFVAFSVAAIAFGQTNGALLPNIPPAFENQNGVAAALGRLCAFAAGTNTPLAIYSDSALTTTLPNPNQLNAIGQPTTNGSTGSAIYIQPRNYKFILYQAGATGASCPLTGTAIWTRDNVYDPALLPSFDNVQICSRFAGATAGAKIAACIAALPSTGGVADAIGIQGAQTVSSDPMGGTTKPVTLLLGAATFTWTGTAQLNSNVKVIGLGPGITVLTISNGGKAFSILGNKVKISGLSVNQSESGSASKFAQIDANIADLEISGNVFTGASTTQDNHGVVFNNFNASRLLLKNNAWNSMAYPILKTNADTSDITDVEVSGSTFTNTCAGVNINSPALGSTWHNTRVINNHFTGTPDVEGCYFVGVAGDSTGTEVTVRDTVISGNTMVGSSRQSIHVEAFSRDTVISGNTIYATAGTSVGRCKIHIISSSNATVVSNNVIDMTGNGGSASCGLDAVAGGAAAPYDLTVTGNTFLTKTSNPAIGIAEVFGAVVSNNIFRNVSAAAKAASFIDLTASHVTGTNNSFYNPGVLVTVNNSSFGSLANSMIDGDLTTATAFGFLTGNSAGNTSVVFDGFSIFRAFTADNVVTANTLFPAGQSFNGVATLRFAQNGVNTGWISSANLNYDGSNFAISNMVQTCGISDTCGPTLTISGGNILGASQRANAATGVVNIKFQGSLVP